MSDENPAPDSEHPLSLENISDIDDLIHYSLVENPDENGDDINILENLLAFHIYKRQKRKDIVRFYLESGSKPNEVYIRNKFATQNSFDLFRHKAKLELVGHLQKFASNETKKESKLAKFKDALFLSVTSKLVTNILLVLITLLLAYLGLDELLNLLGLDK